MMIKPEVFFSILSKCGVEFYTGVPDSLLKNLCAYIIDNTTKDTHIIAANEGNAVALAIGYHLCSNKVPLVYMQNSGLGNAINPLLSLADPEVYSIPMLLLIGWRGEPGVYDEPQHKKQGRITRSLLDAMEINYEVLDPNLSVETISDIIANLKQSALTQKAPVAILVKKNTFDQYQLKQKSFFDRQLFREQAIQHILTNIDKDDIVIATTGLTSRELFECRVENNSGHRNDFLTIGGMGHVSQISLAVSMQRKNQQIFCLDGDGSLLMHMGGLAIIGNMGGSNYNHIIFNNSAHDSVGGQPTVAQHIDIIGIARSSGYGWVRRVSTLDDITLGIREMKEITVPALLEIQIKKGYRSDIGRPTTDPAYSKYDFMKMMQ